MNPTEEFEAHVTPFIRVGNGHYFVVSEFKEDGVTPRYIRDMTEAERTFRRFNVKLAIGEIAR